MVALSDEALPQAVPQLMAQQTGRARERLDCPATRQLVWAMPNGPKVISGGNLSPRGDWRAPSDGNARVWLDELEANVPS